MCLVYITCQIFFELGDCCVDFVRIFNGSVLKCVVNFRSTLTDSTQKESFLVLSILTGNFRDHSVVEPGLFPQLPFFRRTVCKVERRWWFYLRQWRSIHLSLMRSRHRRRIQIVRSSSSRAFVVAHQLNSKQTAFHTCCHHVSIYASWLI